jgi:hypothetical protein
VNDGQRSKCKRHRLLCRILLVRQAVVVLLKSGVGLFTRPLLLLLLLPLLMMLLPPPPPLLLLLRMKKMPGRGNTAIANSGTLIPLPLMNLVRTLGPYLIRNQPSSIALDIHTRCLR